MEEPTSALRIAEVLDRRTARLPEGWADHGWPVTRGVTGPLTEDETAFRLGAWLVDLHAAVDGGDRDAALHALVNVEELLRTIDFAEPALLHYQELRRQISASEQRDVLGSAQDAEAFLDSEHLVKPTLVALGKWTEASRLAAAAGDRDFFARASVKSWLSRLDSNRAGSPAARQEVAALGAILDGGVDPSEMPALRAHVDRLAALGGR
jgi:hypothetical protein